MAKDDTSSEQETVVAPPAARTVDEDRGSMRALYAALAIASMWVAVLFASIYGPDLVTESGSDSVRVPSGVLVAFFAFLATIPVALAGFRRR
jgi:hypothetical protein